MLQMIFFNSWSVNSFEHMAGPCIRTLHIISHIIDSDARLYISHLDKRSSLVHYHLYGFGPCFCHHPCMLHPGHVIYCVCVCFGCGSSKALVVASFDAAIMASVLGVGVGTTEYTAGVPSCRGYQPVTRTAESTSKAWHSHQMNTKECKNGTYIGPGRAKHPAA